MYKVVFGFVFSEFLPLSGIAYVHFILVLHKLNVFLLANLETCRYIAQKCSKQKPAVESQRVLNKVYAK